MTEPRRPTPPGTWPLLISGALLLLVTPAVFLGMVVPDWLSVVGAVLFAVAAVGSFLWSYAVYRQQSGRSSQGVPIAGLIIGGIVAVVAALVIVPYGLA
jgi:hypothetical protein